MKPITVIKIGSQTLLNKEGRLDLAFLDDIARQLAIAVKDGLTPIIVSSGAIACGRAVMSDAEMESTLADRQALAAVGQTQLAHHWQIALDAHGLRAAQILLTNDDFKNRLRYVNITSTLRGLFDHNVIPVVNENDTVAVEELTLGDNDRLSAMLAGQLHAQQLLILTDIDGVYDKDPRKHNDAVLLKEINDIDQSTVEQYGGSAQSAGVGRGGMRSKLEAARIAAEAGVPTRIVAGRQKDILVSVIKGEELGTFIPGRSEEAPDSRRRWLALARHSEGALIIDAGARAALIEKGTSLLPVGITAVEGEFVRGDTVSVKDQDGNELARGLSSLSAGELQQIKGMRMDKAQETLGYVLPKTAIHRDNLYLLNN